MRGSPFRELLLVLALGGLLLPALLALTGNTQPLDRRPAVPAELNTVAVDTWLDLRFSHTPVSVSIWQGERLLMEDGGASRLEADAELDFVENTLRLRMEVEWPETVDEAYAELTLEPEFRKSQTVGFWGSGRAERRWELRWTESP